MDNWGCPAYEKIVVQKDKLELKEKLYFAWDQATLEDASFPVLDEVVQALNDNQSFRVQVEGHTSSEAATTTTRPSPRSAREAVLDYLAAHGIAKDRLSRRASARRPARHQRHHCRPREQPARRVRRQLHHRQ